jgi:hypothetical protein
MQDIDTLFRHVVVMDLSRILSRLRSRHAKKTRKTANRQALPVQLHKALNHSSIKTKGRLDLLKVKAKTLLDLFIRLEGMTDLNTRKDEVSEILREIVILAHDIKQTSILSKVLQTSSLDPTLKIYLPEAIGKISRYYSAPSELVCAARSKVYRMFQNIRVEPFQISIPQSLKEAGMKVHAEIQLLFFYETHHDGLKPRIICSSKSACYLCDLFINIHGGFHIPRTHGRLYDKWILPDWLDVPGERRQHLCVTLRALKTALDKQIRQASKSRNRMTVFPNESVLLPSASWPSTETLSKASALSHGSEATIRATSGRDRTKPSEDVIYSNTGVPPTPPETPHGSPVPSSTINQTREINRLEGANSLENCRAEIQSMASVSAASVLTLCNGDLPYSQAIGLATPWLCLQIEELCIYIDFVRVASGNLSVERERSASRRQGHHVIKAADVPAKKEMHLTRSRESNSVKVQLLTASTGAVCIVFVWDR